MEWAIRAWPSSLAVIVAVSGCCLWRTIGFRGDATGSFCGGTRELVGECHPLAVIACSRNRLTWHVRENAGRHDGKVSFLSKGNNKLMIHQVRTLKNALMVEVAGKLVAVDTSENIHSQGNLLR